MPSAGEREPLSEATERSDTAAADLQTGPSLPAVHEGLLRYGEPFAAWINVCGANRSASRALEEFEASYIGHFPDRFSFTLDRLGYPDYEGSIALFLERLGLPDEAAGWSHERLWQRFYETYRITEAFEGVYAFRR